LAPSSKRAQCVLIHRGQLGVGRIAEGAVHLDRPIDEFLTGTRGAADHTRMLTTLVFTDVFGSTDPLAAIGDWALHTVLDGRGDAVRPQPGRFSPPKPTLPQPTSKV
jgi:hypothetical protein